MSSDIKTLSTETIIVSPDFFKNKGDRVVYPIPRGLIDASDEEELAATWTHIFDKNYERFLPEDIVNVIKKLGYFAFAHILKNWKDDVWAVIYICNIPCLSFIHSSSISTTSTCCWHEMKSCIPEGSFVATVSYADEGTIEFPNERVETRYEKSFEYASDNELFEVTEGHVLFNLLELRLRRILDIT